MFRGETRNSKYEKAVVYQIAIDVLFIWLVVSRYSPWFRIPERNAGTFGFIVDSVLMSSSFGRRK